MQEINKKQQNKRKGRYLLIIIPLILVVFSVIALFPVAEITYYRIKTDKISEPLTIALISDLHSTEYGNAHHRLLRSIARGEPDIIVLAGDIYRSYGDAQSRESTTKFIENCAKITTTYFEPGNHETANPDYWQILREVKETGAIVIDTPFIDIDDYRILVTHYPMDFQFYIGTDWNVDLMLAGHAHGGQVRIPLLFPQGLYSPDQGRFPKYTGGKYEINDDFTLIVSRGLSKVGPSRFRVFNRPELVFVTVGE